MITGQTLAFIGTAMPSNPDRGADYFTVPGQRAAADSAPILPALVVSNAANIFSEVLRRILGTFRGGGWPFASAVQDFVLRVGAGPMPPGTIQNPSPR